MQSFGRRTGLILFTLLWSSNVLGVPETINIQGSIEATGVVPVAGTHSYSIGFHTDAVGGTELASMTGEVSVSMAGRFSIDILLPQVVLSAPQVWYELAIDVADDALGPGDLFPERVRIHSVPFALHSALSDIADHAASADTATMAGHAATADTANQATSAITAETATLSEHATTADSAMGLSGPLSDPGDQIQLGNDVFLQVAADGMVELLAGGARMRLARQRWFDPRNLQDNISPDGETGQLPQVALNNNGDAVIVWRQSDGANNQIFRSENRDGSWSDPTGLSDNISPDGPSADNPQVALNDNGDVVVVWQQRDSSSNIQIFRSEYRNGSWSDPTDLSDNISPDGQNAFDPQVAMSDNGDAVIVWYQSDISLNQNSQIFRSEYRNGSWTDPASLLDNISPSGQDALRPQVAMNADGEAVIVWNQSNGGNDQIFRSEYRNGSWSDPTDLSDNISPDGQDAGVPQVAMNDSGDAVIVWNQRTISLNQDFQIFRSEYRNGSWTDPMDIFENISPNGQAAFEPQVAMSDNGDAVIVWRQGPGANPQIFRSEYRNGTWRDPADLSDNFNPGGTPSALARVDLNENGDAVIVWRQSDGTIDQIFRSEHRDGSWTDPANLSDNISPDGTPASSPQVALNGNGDAVVVWYQFAIESFQIFRSEFRFGF